MDLWQKRAQRTAQGNQLGYETKKDGLTIGLLRKPSIEPWDEFTCLNSLRDVEPTANLILITRGMRSVADGCISVLLPAYPDATNLASIRAVPRPRSSNISSGFVIRGFRPVIQTLPNQAPLADGDYVFIGMKADGTRVVLRTLSISSITAQAHWDDPNKAQQIGPPVPAQADLVQVGGGHQAPVFFVGDASGRVWKLDAAKAVWNAIVPGGPPGRKSFFATRFFVDPYNPGLIYLVDSTEIRVSLDGGASWLPEPSLRRAVTARGLISISATVIQDMLFVRCVRGEYFVGRVGGLSRWQRREPETGAS
jgi:hypothetical protein